MLNLTTRLDIGHAGEDQLFAQASGDRALVAIADGAGGTGSGRQAATFLCDRVIHESGEIHDGAWWSTWLSEIDRQLESTHPGAETTAVVVQIAHGEVSGASVGDSAAWLVSETGVVDLTAGQRAKPRLGSGHATPVAFGPIQMVGQLLVATDGLFNYSGFNSISTCVREADPAVAADQLVDGVRLRSGALPDDLALVLCGNAAAGAADTALIGTETVVHVRLLDEGTPVYRPAKAVIQSHYIVVLEPPLDYETEAELWEFPPGSVVRVGFRVLEDRVAPVAVAIADNGPTA